MSTILGARITPVWKSAALLSLPLILFGLLAITVPIATSLGVVFVVGWLLLLDGLTQVNSRLSVQRHWPHRLEARSRGFLYCGRILSTCASDAGSSGSDSGAGNLLIR